MLLGVAYKLLLAVYLIHLIMVCNSKCMELHAYMLIHMHIHISIR